MSGLSIRNAMASREPALYNTNPLYRAQIDALAQLLEPMLDGLAENARRVYPTLGPRVLDWAPDLRLRPEDLPEDLRHLVEGGNKKDPEERMET